MRKSLAIVLAGSAFLLPGGGCQLVGGMMQSYYENSTKTVPTEWDGLKGKTLGILVALDPTLHARFPQMELQVLSRVTERLAKVDPEGKKDTGITGITNIRTALSYSANHPGWISKSSKELAEALGGVDCLLIVEIDELQLYDPGNMYTWDGVASGSVGVYDLTGALPGEFAFRKGVTVRFPDKSGYTSETLPGDAVSTELLRRFIDRATWPFYEHEEPYYPKY